MERWILLSLVGLLFTISTGPILFRSEHGLPTNGDFYGLPIPWLMYSDSGSLNPIWTNFLLDIIFYVAIASIATILISVKRRGFTRQYIPSSIFAAIYVAVILLVAFRLYTAPPLL